MASKPDVIDTTRGRLNLVSFDPLSARPAEWAAFHAFRRVLHAEQFPDIPPTPDADVEFRQRQNAADEEWLVGALHVLDDHLRVVARVYWDGESEASSDFEANGHILWPMITVLPEWRRRGIGTRLLAEVLAVMRTHGQRVLTAWLRLPSGRAFAARFGFAVKQVMPEYELRLDAIDWPEIDRWRDALAARAPGYTSELHPERVPPALRGEYCAAKVVLSNLSPRDDLDMGDWTFTSADLEEDYKAKDHAGARHHNVLVRSPAGEIVAITDTAWNPNRPRLVQQLFTGVHPDHRGRGLGKHIKARMLRHVVARHGADGIERVRTGTATTNAPMMAINARMGFVEHARAEVVQAERAVVTERLAAARGTDGSSPSATKR